MDINQIHANLARLKDDGTVIEALFLIAGYGEIRAFVKLTISLPYSAEREKELTQRARQATGFPNIPVYFEYVREGRGNG